MNRRALRLLLVFLVSACALSGSVRISGRFGVGAGSQVHIQTGGPGLEVRMTNAGESPLLVTWKQTFWGSLLNLPLAPGESRQVPAPHKIRFTVTNTGDAQGWMVWATEPVGSVAEEPDGPTP